MERESFEQRTLTEKIFMRFSTWETAKISNKNGAILAAAIQMED